MDIDASVIGQQQLVLFFFFTTGPMGIKAKDFLGHLYKCFPDISCACADHPKEITQALHFCAFMLHF